MNDDNEHELQMAGTATCEQPLPGTLPPTTARPSRPAQALLSTSSGWNILGPDPHFSGPWDPDHLQ